MEAIEITARITEEDIQAIVNQIRPVMAEEIERLMTESTQAITLFSTEDTCKILKCSRPTLQRWRERGYIEGSQIGGKYLYSETAIRKAKELGVRYKR